MAKDILQGTLQTLEDLQSKQRQIAAHIKQQLLERIHNDITALKRVGFFYSLVPVARSKNDSPVEQRKKQWREALKASNGAAAKAKPAKKRSKKKYAASGTLTDAPCKVCGFKTAPLHDGRKHRHNQDTIKPFTAADLERLGLQKIDWVA